MGGRGRRLVSADRFLLQEAIRGRSRHEGVHREPGRGFRLSAGHLRAVLDDRLGPVRRHLRAGSRTGADADAISLGRLEFGRGSGGAAVHRCDGQVGAAFPAYLAARRDGGPDPGFGADPCRDHGHRGCLSCCPDVAALRIRARRQAVHHRDRRDDGLLRGDRGSGAERHQARDRLFDLFAAGLHVRGRRRRRLFGRDVPPSDPRLLQGAAVSGRGFGHPRDASRTGHAELWRPATENPADLLDHADRHPGDHRRRDTADRYRIRGLPVEGRGDRKRLGGQHLCLLAAGHRRRLHQLLFLAADVHDLLGHAARRPAHA